MNVGVVATQMLQPSYLKKENHLILLVLKSLRKLTGLRTLSLLE